MILNVRRIIYSVKTPSGFLLLIPLSARTFQQMGRFLYLVSVCRVANQLDIADLFPPVDSRFNSRSPSFSPIVS